MAKKTRPAANKSRPAKNVRLEEAIQQLLNNVTTGLNSSQEHFELSNVEVEFTLLLSGNSEWILDLSDGTSKAKGTAHKVKLYPVHAKTRKSFGEMTRKLSVTASQ
jgi:hypothetical protein